MIALRKPHKRDGLRQGGSERVSFMMTVSVWPWRWEERMKPLRHEAVAFSLR